MLESDASNSFSQAGGWRRGDRGVSVEAVLKAVLMTARTHILIVRIRPTST